MKKSDLIKLLETASDDQDINELILGNEEFKSLGKADLTKLTVDEFKNLLNTNEGVKGYQQSLIDSAVSKGVASYETNTLPKKIEEAIKQASNKNKTPEQIKLEELEEKLAEMESQKIKAELQNKYTKTLTEKGFDTSLLDLCFDESEENFNSKLEKITNIIQASTEKEVQTRLKDGEYKPPKSNNPNIITKEDFSKMGYKERTNLYSENKALYDELSKE